MTEGGALRTVAALYVDPLGPYPTLAGVECWDESRNAKTYPGPHPVVAHPPCGPWSRLRHLSRYQDPECGLVAVDQVRRWGGVLEHPDGSRLFRVRQLPLPGGLPDEFGGWSALIDQVSWGHKARKRTLLYVVGVHPSSVRFRVGGEPTHLVTTCHRGEARTLPTLSAAARRRTPLDFAEFLVALARAV